MPDEPEYGLHGKFGFSDIVSDEPYHYYGFFDVLDKDSALRRAILHFRNDYDDVDDECKEIWEGSSSKDVDMTDELDIRVIANIVANFNFSLQVDFSNLESFVEDLADVRETELTESERENLDYYATRLRDHAALLGAMIEWSVLHAEHGPAMQDGYQRQQWRDQGLELARNAKLRQGELAKKHCIRAAKNLWGEKPHLSTNISATARKLASLDDPTLAKPDGSQLTPASIEKYIRKARRDGAFDDIFPRKFRTPENPLL